MYSKFLKFVPQITHIYGVERFLIVNKTTILPLLWLIKELIIEYILKIASVVPDMGLIKPMWALRYNFFH